MHEPKCGVHKMATPLGIFRGSSLNLKWSKCGVWWVDQWVLISWLHIKGSRAFTWDIDMLIMLVDHVGWSCWLIILVGDSNIASFLMLNWYICMRYLTCWLWDWLSWLRILFFLCASFPCLLSNTDMLIILIDHLALLSIVILIFAMIVLIALHIWIYCYTSFDLTCRLSRLYILLFVFEQGICITFSSDLS